MGYNWAGMGSALGSGMSKGIMQGLAPKFELAALKKKIDWLNTLPTADRALAVQMMGKNDPFGNLMAMMQSAAQGGTGSSIGPEQPGMPMAPIQPTGLSSKIRVRRLSDGAIGTIDNESEFDPKVYERIP
jgi:hypothetical protein